jgi:hypothetical protein
MTRKEKINLLQAINAGRATIDVLEPPRTYFFYTTDIEPDKFERDGKTYTKAEYLAFCEKVEKRNNRTLIWDEKKHYGHHKIITIEGNLTQNEPLK